MSSEAYATERWLRQVQRCSAVTAMGGTRRSLPARTHGYSFSSEAASMETNLSSRAWTRRRFLRTIGILAAGSVPAGAVAYELARAAGAGPGSSPSPGPLLAALGSEAPAGGSDVTGSGAPAGRRSFLSRPDLAPPVVSVGTPARSVAPGYVFLTPNNGAGVDGPTIVDNDGELVWMRPDTGQHATDFRVSQYLGRPVLTWWEGSTYGGIGSGECVIADGRYREIARIRAGTGRTVDLHELEITPQGTALFFADAIVDGSRQLAGGKPLPWPVVDCAIQEVDIATGALLWEWHAIDHIALDESLAGTPTTAGSAYDYAHTNAIQLQTDGSLLVSARNTSTIYRIERPGGTIAWRLGGRRNDFRIGPGASFGWQHDARIRPDGTLTVFDDEAPPVPARALVLRLDESARTADLVRAYSRPSPDLVSSQGNVQLLANGNVFVGWGSTPYCSEFSPDGRLLFDAAFPSAVQSYRDFRCEWVGEPADDPAIAVDSAAGGLTVHASWNGATEVARWDVLAGERADSLTVVASAPRSGFETSIPAASAASLVAARAFDAAGHVLGTSAVVATAAAPSPSAAV